MISGSGLGDALIAWYGFPWLAAAYLAASRADNCVCCGLKRGGAYPPARIELNSWRSAV